jgi:hypothetical protein
MAKLNSHDSYSFEQEIHIIVVNPKAKYCQQKTTPLVRISRQFSASLFASLT